MVGATMIPINELQSKIYSVLSNNVNIKVYDDVPQTATMPMLVIGDYIVQETEEKDIAYSFEWKLDVYTEYEGKKEVNQIVSDVSNYITELVDENADWFNIDSVSFSNANVYRQEGYYLANITIKIEIEVA